MDVDEADLKGIADKVGGTELAAAVAGEAAIYQSTHTFEELQLPASLLRVRGPGAGTCMIGKVVSL
jgi:hypothetical protein